MSLNKYKIGLTLIMVKIRIRTGRGTGIKEIDSDQKSWAGDAYKKIQDEKKKQTSNRTVSMGRGTGSRKLGDVPDSKPRPTTDGMTRITGRGTSSKKSKKSDSS